MHIRVLGLGMVVSSRIDNEAVVGMYVSVPHCQTTFSTPLPVSYMFGMLTSPYLPHDSHSQVPTSDYACSYSAVHYSCVDDIYPVHWVVAAKRTASSV